MPPILSSGEISSERMQRYILIAKDNIWPTVTPSKKGSIACPACGGKLHFQMAKQDQQSIGQCETDHCVKWS